VTKLPNSWGDLYEHACWLVSGPRRPRAAILRRAQWTQHRAPAAAPPEHISRGRVVAIIVAVIVGIVGIGAIVALGTIGERKERAADERSTGEHRGTEAAAPTAAPAGSVVRDGKFAFQVKDMRRSGVAGDPSNPYMRVQAQGEFIILQVAVQNIASEPQSYFGTNQKLIDTVGNEYSTTSAADMYTNSAMGDINPGNTIQVVMSFDVPVNTVAAELELHDSMFSGGTRVALDDPRGR
jgi:hypothetical protein